VVLLLLLLLVVRVLQLLTLGPVMVCSRQQEAAGYHTVGFLAQMSGCCEKAQLNTL
jgi:hypothetical protein